MRKQKVKKLKKRLPTIGKLKRELDRFFSISFRWDPRNVWPQDYACNIAKKGAPTEYWLFLEKEIGRNQMDELITLRLKPFPLKRDWLETQILHYKTLNATYQDF